MKIINVGNRIMNTCVIKIDKGYLLVDTGYYEQYETFVKKIKDKGIQIKEISYVFLTHAHDDHAGFLNEVLKNTDAKVILHKKAVKRLKKGQNSFNGGCTSQLSNIFCFIMKLLKKGEHKFPIVDKPKRYIILDDINIKSIEKKLDIKIMNLPGHTKDSIGFITSNGTLFCGDAAMNGLPSLKRISIWIENKDDYKKSWKDIIAINPSIIYPSHGKPFMKEDLMKNIHKIDKVKLYSLKK